MSIETFNMKTLVTFIESVGSDSLGAYGGLFEGGQRILQNPYEFAMCILWCEHALANVTNILEIGVAHGASSYVLQTVFEPDRHLAMDIEDVRYKQGAEKSLKNVELWVGDSTSDAARDHLKESGLVFDLCHIDGDHSYKTVRNDLELVLPFCRNNSRIIFHDTKHLAGPRDLMEEIKSDSVAGVRCELQANMGGLGTTVVVVTK